MVKWNYGLAISEQYSQRELTPTGRAFCVKIECLGYLKQSRKMFSEFKKKLKKTCPTHTERAAVTFR